MLTIIDYDCGNPASILNMLKKIGCEAIISSDQNDILNASKLILPGVGSFDHGMTKLEELDLVDVLNKKVIQLSTPILGVCLGVQLFCLNSCEGVKSGLGWINADVVKFEKEKLSHFEKIPHMGWTDTDITQLNTLMSNNVEQRFYYVHSYHLDCHDLENIIATANYGYKFTSAIGKDNIYGVQFHPEKSHKFGMQLLKNFADHC